MADDGKVRTKSTSKGASASHTFQVNLAGIIDLLSAHLYSGPHVYLRELLQNAVDAIEARRQLGEKFEGEIVAEVVAGSAPTLTFEDNGIGLTEEEVHRFLATIGSSSKRDSLAAARADFIGQFGIGLLSAFMVCDEIVMVTRSAKPGHPALEWRGNSDGSYKLRVLDGDARPGTKVFLRAKPSAKEFLDAQYVSDHLKKFGEFLPHRIEFAHDGTRARLNCDEVLWESKTVERRRCLELGERMFRTQFLDCFPLEVPAVGLSGVAFVLASSPSLAARRSDRVYLKRMLLSEHADGLLPEWAFFVRCVFNVTNLSPNAAREGLQEDRNFERAREGLGKCLRDYLLNLARRDRDLLEKMIAAHYRAIKVLASDDDEFYRIFIDLLPFETSQGRFPMSRIRADADEILYVSDIDSFRQLSQVAAAQGMCLINAGYECDADLIERLPEVFPNVTVRKLNPHDLLDSMEEIPADDRAKIDAQLDAIADRLDRFACDIEVRCFRPAELAALYSLDDIARYWRDLKHAKEQTNPLFQGLLDGMAGPQSEPARGCLCLNWRNPLVRQLLALQPDEVLDRTSEMLYVQALLQGHFPLGAAEHRLLGEGLGRLLEMAIQKSS